MSGMKIGFLIDRPVVENYVAELFRECDAKSDGKLTIIQNRFEDKNKLTIMRRLKEFGIKRSIQKFTFSFLNRLELKLLRIKHADEYTAAFAPTSLTLDNYKIIEIAPLWSRANLMYKYGADDIQKLKDEGFDLIVRGEGRGILHGEILDTARCGIISFHYGDNRKYRGVPAGFWEVYFKDPKSEVIIQVLNNSIDNGEIIARNTFNTERTHLLNCNNLFAESANLIHGVLQTFKQTGKLPKAENTQEKKGQLYTTPTLRQTAKYLPALIRHILF